MAKIDWGWHIETWQRSGLSQAAYFRREGLSAGYFSQRIRAYRARCCGRKEFGAVPGRMPAVGDSGIGVTAVGGGAAAVSGLIGAPSPLAVAI